jgi:hypothetical protein
MTAPTYNLSEAFDGLRTAMLADTDFAALLATNQSIYLEPPAVKVSSPLAEWIFRAWNPADLTSPGLYRPALSMNIFAKTPQLAWNVVNYLEVYWSIPLRRPAGVTTTNFRITHLSLKNAVHVGPTKLLNSLEQVHQVATEWDLRIVRQS